VLIRYRICNQFPLDSRAETNRNTNKWTSSIQNQ